MKKIVLTYLVIFLAVTVGVTLVELFIWSPIFETTNIIARAVFSSIVLFFAYGFFALVLVDEIKLYKKYNK